MVRVMNPQDLLVSGRNGRKDFPAVLPELRRDHLQDFRALHPLRVPRGRQVVGKTVRRDKAQSHAGDCTRARIIGRVSQPTFINAPGIPKPAGPYAPGVLYESLLFVSGQGARDPRTEQLVGTDVESQTEQVLKNIQAILQAGGSDLQYVLRCGVYLIDIGEFSLMNGVYARMFGGHTPARTTVQVAGLPAPGLRVEIDCVAYVP